VSSGGEPRESARPVLLAVDDEPSVARVVERDLRKRYGRDCRVRRAESGAGALDVLRESTLRGAPTPDEVRLRIFEPFFTTKPVGQSTGLGLDIARRIVLAHRGDLTHRSRPGSTEFVVTLPLGKAVAADGAA
jgi:nitrogen-specific signal transduction histidine kinase